MFDRIRRFFNDPKMYSIKAMGHALLPALRLHTTSGLPDGKRRSKAEAIDKTMLIMRDSPHMDGINENELRAYLMNWWQG